MSVNRSIAARILRVNHGGEHGAIRIYESQIAIARFRAPGLLPFLREALIHEQSHLLQFRALMPARNAKPCRMMWIWAIGGAVLGGITAILGREAILACTQAVEQTVHRHLADQIAWASGQDEELCRVIASIQIEELSHLAYATDHRTASGFGWLERLISGATEGLIQVSTRGDSRRLARELGNASAI